MNSAMEKQLSALDPQMREYFEERASILEFDCKLSRPKAEFLAWEETKAAIKKAAKTPAQRIAAMAQHQREQARPLHMPRHAPIADRKQLAGGAA